ncbi:hypothetical protein O181_122043 [Austropuccinia psidii MF-1]|uniref:Uncharacterized protein n=1 Tax=Austropuccinia psidii MF-1 TaxID=1389203 RepID=A0A9Q3KIN6_9BASI|nr:hypothetical protein [Austropuccinia psidii MF-1]
MLIHCVTIPTMQQDALARTPLLSMMMKAFLSRNGLPDPKLADANNSGRLAQCPPVLICPPPLQGHHPMVTSLLDWREVIIRPMKHRNGKRKFKLGMIVTMGFKHQIKKNPTKSPLTRHSHSWYASQSKFVGTDSRPKCHPMVGGLVPFPSQSSEFQVPSHEDASTCEPEPEVAPMQSTEERFARPATPCSVIIIDDTPIGSPPPSTPTPIPSPEIPSFPQ